MPNSLSLPCTNLRYLLWKDKIPKKDWAKHLADWVKISEARASSYLKGKESPSLSELETVLEIHEMQDRDIVTEDLIASDGLNLLAENIRDLFARRGSQKEFQDEHGIDPSTTSKWTRGKHPPSQKNRIQILKFFGLSTELDLSQQPLFLEIEPLGVSGRKEWLKDRIDLMDSKEFSSLYPALQKLLGD